MATSEARTFKVGPILSFQDANVTVVENSFVLKQTDRSPSGYTVYRIDFKVRTATPKGEPVIQECATWKRFSDFQNLARQLDSIHSSVSANTGLPSLVKASYFDRFKDTVIEERRVSAEALLQFTSSTLHLSSSLPLTSFLTGATVVRILPINKSEGVTTTTVDHKPDSSSINQSNDSSSEDKMADACLDEERELSEEYLKDIDKGYIRSDSVTVSEWGLEHTLKLREEGRPDNDPLPEEEEEGEPPLFKTTPPTHISIDKAEGGEEEGGGEELQLPSTPVIVSKTVSKRDWWSEAMAESRGVVEDYDTLIESIESKKDSFIYVYKKNSEGVYSASKSPSPQKDESGRRIVPSANGEYVLQAGKLITLGLEYEKKGDIEEAFDLFKAGVDVLLSGVQTDTSTSRREAVRKKTSEYLQYTEVLQDKLRSKQALKKNSNAKPHLIKDFKILSIIAKTVMFVESVHTSQRFVFKVLHKSLIAQKKSNIQGRTRSKNRSPTQCPYMVNLLHHYETQSNRIFLLLEHVSGGQLIKHVQSIRSPSKKRQRRKKAKKETENGRTRMVVGGEIPSTKEGDEGVLPPSLAGGHTPKSPHDEEDDIMLAKLKSLEPPPSHPVLSSLISISSDSTNEEDSLTRLARIVKEDAEMAKINEEKESDECKDDRLTDLRRQLMESFLEDDKDTNHGDDGLHGNSGLHDDDDLHGDIEVKNESIGSNSGEKEEGNEEPLDVMDEDNIIRPEPAGEDGKDNEELSELEKHLMAFVSKPIVQEEEENREAELEGGVSHIPSDSNIDTNGESVVNSLAPPTIDSKGLVSAHSPSMVELSEDVQQLTPESNNVLTRDPSPATIQVVPATPTTSNPAPLSRPSTSEQLSVRRDQDQSTPPEKNRKSTSPGRSPEFSPVVSLRGSPDPASFGGSTPSREAEIERNSRKWAAQIVLALDHLHANGIVCRDLHPGNILLTSSSDVKLTYIGKWDYVIPTVKNEAIKKFYVAPELLGVEEASPVSDWWSLGAVLFEIIVGKSLVDCHPGGVHSHIPLTIPSSVSAEACSLLQGLLQVNSRERLGSGMNGVEDIKTHPFFHSIDWTRL